MTLKDSRQVGPEPSSVSSVHHPVVVREELWACALCGRGIIELVALEQGDGVEPQKATELWRKRVWPELLPRELDQAVPAPVRSFYQEASRAENAGSLRLAGVGYRAAVEEVCKDKGAVGGTLYAKIADLASKGLDQDVADALHAGRVVGNDSIHHNLAYALDEIADLAEIIKEAVEILYVQPAKRAQMAAARAQRSAAAKVPAQQPTPPAGP